MSDFLCLGNHLIRKSAITEVILRLANQDGMLSDPEVIIYYTDKHIIIETATDDAAQKIYESIKQSLRA